MIDKDPHEVLLGHEDVSIDESEGDIEDTKEDEEDEDEVPYGKSVFDTLSDYEDEEDEDE